MDEAENVGGLLPQATPSSGQEEQPVEDGLVQVIGLSLGEDHFIVDIRNVAEIVRLNELLITAVPRAHPYVIGVANLRGKVVPVIDLALRIGLCTERGEDRRMLAVEIGDMIVGFTVDSVSQIQRLPRGALDLDANAAREEYIEGVATIDGQISTMLDLGKLLKHGTQTPEPGN